MNRKLRFAIIFFGAFAITAPALAAPNWPDTATNYVKSERKRVKTVGTKGYLAVVKNPNGALILDVCKPEEFKARHVPGAVNIPRGVLEFKIYKYLGYPKKVDTGCKIFVQCQTGGRATLATASLKKIGFKNVTAAIVNMADRAKAGHPWVKRSHYQLIRRRKTA